MDILPDFSDVNAPIQPTRKPRKKRQTKAQDPKLPSGELTVEIPGAAEAIREYVKEHPLISEEGLSWLVLRKAQLLVEKVPDNLAQLVKDELG